MAGQATGPHESCPTVLDRLPASPLRFQRSLMWSDASRVRGPGFFLRRNTHMNIGSDAVVTIAYTLKDDNGQVIDSSEQHGDLGGH